MVPRSLVPRLTDIVEAIERIHGVLENISLQEFETDWQRQWLVERGIEIISEASRHLTDEMKARHPEKHARHLRPQCRARSSAESDALKRLASYRNVRRTA
jgi:uncharacterized protein with HEPN domain